MVSRQSALFAAFVALLVYGAQLAHWVLLSHEICASHGEIVHDDDHGEHEAASGEAPRHASELTQSGGDEEEHDHCTALANETTGCIVDAPTLSASLSWQLVATSPTISALVVERLYLLAPKTSPPSVS